MEVRALEFSPDLAQDILIFSCEDKQGDFSFPNWEKICQSYDFTGKYGEIFSYTYFTAEQELRHIIACGLGKKAELTLEKFRRAYGKGLKEARKQKIAQLATYPLGSTGLPLLDMAKALAEVSLLSAYQFDCYLGEKKPQTLEVVQIGYSQEQEAEITAGIKLGQILGETTNLARQLVNEPANFLTPVQLAKEAVEAGEKYGFQVEVLDLAEIEKLGMHALLEVGRASVNEPRFIIMRHLGNPEKPEEILGLVGKGLTYDSGGLSIKPGDSMRTMKSDMAGSAAVIGTMGAIAQTDLKVNVVAVVAACENLIDGKGYRPGDIINTMAGKSILIESTDAEGRLTLADAVHYIITEEKAKTVVDIATLTGACVIALGEVASGVITNDQELYAKLEEAAEKSGERVWQLPSFPEYREQNKTPIADLKNTGGRPAGTITAGLFIEAFVQDTPWLHLDIAGTSFSAKDSDYLAQGATGVGVRLLYHLAKSFV